MLSSLSSWELRDPKQLKLQAPMVPQSKEANMLVSLQRSTQREKHYSYVIVADRRNRRFYRRRGPPRQPRPTQQDSQGEDKTEGTEGVMQDLFYLVVQHDSVCIGEGSGEQIDRRRPRGPRRRFRNRRGGPPRRTDEEACAHAYLHHHVTTCTCRYLA